MKISEVYSSTGGFLKADDLGNAKPTVTISDIELTERDYNDGKGMKKQLVLSFVGKEKKLGLNKVNADKLAELTGSDDTDDWIGVTIKLFVEKVQVGSEKKNAIRIWPELPEQKQVEPVEMTGTPEPDENGDIPW
jgi:hypothetical protein